MTDFLKRFGLQSQPKFERSYNIAPGQQVPVIYNDQAELFRWGLVPKWSKDADIGYKMINARVETLEEKPSYKDPLRKQRCLIPATGFYEWQHSPEGKLPYYIHPTDQQLFAFAGLYSVWQNPQGGQLKTFTIITTVANDLIHSIHSRMPVILTPEDEQTWLDSDSSLSQLNRVMKVYPSQKMQLHPVSRKINNPESEGPELISATALHSQPGLL